MRRVQMSCDICILLFVLHEAELDNNVMLLYVRLIFALGESMVAVCFLLCSKAV